MCCGCTHYCCRRTLHYAQPRSTHYHRARPSILCDRALNLRSTGCGSDFNTPPKQSSPVSLASVFAKCVWLSSLAMSSEYHTSRRYVGSLVLPRAVYRANPQCEHRQALCCPLHVPCRQFARLLSSSHLGRAIHQQPPAPRPATACPPPPRERILQKQAGVTTCVRGLFLRQRTERREPLPASAVRWVFPLWPHPTCKHTHALQPRRRQQSRS